MEWKVRSTLCVCAQDVINGDTYCGTFTLQISHTCYIWRFQRCKGELENENLVQTLFKRDFYVPKYADGISCKRKRMEWKGRSTLCAQDVISGDTYCGDDGSAFHFFRRWLLNHLDNATVRKEHARGWQCVHRARVIGLPRFPDTCELN